MMPQDNEDEEQTESEGGDDEEVDGDDVSDMRGEKGFRLYWRWKSRPNPVGRPKLDAEIRHLIRRMARENPMWGRRRIRAELALLGYRVAELTVARYMHRTSPRPSPTWRTLYSVRSE